MGMLSKLLGMPTEADLEAAVRRELAQEQATQQCPNPDCDATIAQAIESSGFGPKRDRQLLCGVCATEYPPK